jgi:hypothetical protein
MQTAINKIESKIKNFKCGKITDGQLEIIKSHFSKITKQEFETDIKLVPVWIRKILLTL